MKNTKNQKLKKKYFYFMTLLQYPIKDQQRTETHSVYPIYSQTDSYGPYATIAVDNFSSQTTLYFIVKNDSWNKDYSDDRSIDIQNLVPDSDGYYHIYL